LEEGGEAGERLGSLGAEASIDVDIDLSGAQVGRVG